MPAPVSGRIVEPVSCSFIAPGPLCTPATLAEAGSRSRPQRSQLFAFMHHDPTSTGICTVHQRKGNAAATPDAAFIRKPDLLFTTDPHLTNQTVYPGRHSWMPGKGPLPKLPGRVLYRAAADRRNTTRATIRESSRQSNRAGRNSSTSQLRKTDSTCGRQCTPRMAPALVPSMCPGSVLVLCRCSDRRLGLRCRRPRQTAAASRIEAHARRN